MTISDLATQMDMNRNLVAKYLDMLLISGQVEMQVVGAAKVYFLSHRVPISSMLEFSSDMVIVLDSEQKIVQVNEPVLLMLRERKDALVGRHLKDIDNSFFRAVPSIIPSKDTDTSLEQVREMGCRLEGKKHHFRVKQLPTTFEDGNQGITLIIEDISAQVMYQEMLELNEARYRGIVEDQTEFITRFLPDGKLVFVNDAYARYLGKTKEELLGGLHIPHLESEDIPAVSMSILALNEDNPVVTFECRIHHTCDLTGVGEERWNLWTVRVLFDDEKKPVEYQGIGRDNTEKHEAATRINLYIKDMEFLSRKSQEFVELSPDIDIFHTIGQGISEIIPDSLITVSSIDVLSDTLTVRAVLPEQDRELLTKYIGRDLLGFPFKISLLPEQKKMDFFNAQQAGKLVNVQENLHIIFFQQIPQDTCDLIEKNLDLGDCLYTIGLARHGILFGNVSFSLRKGKTLTNSSIIETFVRQAAVVLHRRRTDDALKASELRYRGIVEDQTEFVTRFLPEGILTYVNDSVTSYFQKERGELLGQSIFSLVLPADQDTLIQSLLSLNTHNPVRTIEHRVLDPSGRVRWTQWTNRAHFDDKGAIIEYQGVGRDITEQKEADAKIRQYIADIEFLSQKSHEFLELPPDADMYGTICRGVKEILPNAIVLVNSFDLNNDATTRSVLGDEERDVFSTLMGEDIIGKIVKVPRNFHGDNAVKINTSGRIVRVPGNFFVATQKSVPEAVCTKIEETLNIGDIYLIGLVSQGIVLADVVIILRRGDKLGHVDLIEAYIRQASIALLRCKTEQTLKKSESRYRGIVEDQTELVTRFLTDGTLTYVNDSVCRYFLKDRSELLGQSIFSPVLKDDQERIIQDLHSLNADNPVRTTENRMLDGGGHIRWTQWTTRALLGDHGKIIEYQGVGRDITEQKEAEAKIRQYIANIEFISRASYEFLELSPEADIYEIIGKGVKTILPNAIIVVNSIELKTAAAVTRSVLGHDDCTTFSSLLGEDFIGKSVILREGFEGDMSVKDILSGRVVKVPGNLHLAFQRQVPEEVCDRIQDVLNIGDIYAIGLVSQGIILANIAILLRKGDTLEHTELIETYTRQASIALLRRNTEETLKKNEKLYRSVIENIQDVFYRSDTTGNLIMASPSWARMLGYDSLNDCIGHNIAEKFYFEPERRKEFLDAVFRNDSVNDYPVVLKCRDGSPLCVLTNSHRYYDDAGEFLGVEGIFRDIGDRPGNI